MKLIWSLSYTIFYLFGLIYPRLDDKVLGAPNIAYLKDSLINFSDSFEGVYKLAFPISRN